MNTDAKNVGFSVFLVVVIACVGLMIGLSLYDTLRGVEGMTNKYQSYDESTASDSGTMILAQKNAGNIEVLKGRLDDGKNLDTRMSRAEQQIDLMQHQIDGLVQQQSNYATELAGGDAPLSVTGTSE